MSLQAFLDALGTGVPGEETYDLDAIATLDAADRSAAEAALAERARRTRDVRAALTLAAIDSELAVDVLEDVGEAAVGDLDRVLIARALGRLSPGAAVVPDLVVQLASPGKYARFGACQALSEHDTATSRAALRTALADTDPLVRSAAFNALLTLEGLLDLTTDPDGNDHILSPLRVLELRLRSSLEALAAPARTRFAAMLESPSRMALAYTSGTPPVDRRTIGRGVAKRSDALPIAAMRATSGHDRDWVEALLLSRLAPGIADERVPAALAALGIDASAVLAEARAALADDHPLAQAIDAQP